MPEAWLAGPVEGVPTALMPTAHALLDAEEDLRQAAAGLTVGQLWMRPGGAASVGFHLRHVPGSVERLLTYAKGGCPTEEQLAAIRGEGEPGDPPATADDLLSALGHALAAALDALRATPPDTLPHARSVGRSGLPSTVQGLLFHAAEHARRHAGQAVATAAIIRGLGDRLGAEAVRAACVEAAIRAYEDAGIRGLCAVGRWEVALDAVRGLDLDRR